MIVFEKSYHGWKSSGEVNSCFEGPYKSQEFNILANEEVASDPDQFARAYAESYGWKIAPHKETALNRLGLLPTRTNIFQYG